MNGTDAQQTSAEIAIPSNNFVLLIDIRDQVQELLSRIPSTVRDDETSRWEEIMGMVRKLKNKGELSSLEYRILLIYMHFPLWVEHSRARLLVLNSGRTPQENHELAAWMAHPWPEQSTLREQFLAPLGSLSSEEAMSLC